jgi:hypothetical protein
MRVLHLSKSPFAALLICETGYLGSGWLLDVYGSTWTAIRLTRQNCVPTGYGPSSAVGASGKSGWEVARSNPDYAVNMLPHVEKRRVMNCVLCVGTPPTFVTVDGAWGSVGYIWQHFDRDQVDTPELCSNSDGQVDTSRSSRVPLPAMIPISLRSIVALILAQLELMITPL